MTAGPNIRINADVSGINKALDELRNKVQQATKPINGKAAIDTSAAKKGIEDLQKAVDTLHDSLSGSGESGIGAEGLQQLSAGFEDAVKEATELQQVVSKINGAGATAFGKSVAETRNLIREMEKARRLQAALKREGHDVSLGRAGEVETEFQRRLSLGGAGTRKLKRFGSLSGVMENWRDLSPLSEVDARREHRNLMRSLGFAALPAADGPGGGSDGGGRAGATGGGFWRGALGLNRGALASEGASIASSVSPMLGAGLRGGLIGMAAYGVTRAVGAVHQKIRSAEDESIGYSDLGRQMGATASDFQELRNAVRSASEGLGMAYSETANLARRYVGESGVDGMGAGSLRHELAGAAGFSRSLGLDPSRGVDLFATMRHNKVTSGDADNRRLALLLADAIGKAGVFSKADDVLAAVENFTQVATRSSFAPANVQGYIGGMAGLMGTLPGLDPSAAAGLLGKADAAIRSGGGPAARNFFLGMMMKDTPGMDATDIGFLNDGGAFGTAASAFGKNSAAYQMAAARGDKALQAKYESFARDGRTTNLDRILSGLEANSVGTQATKESVKGYFGYSDSEAAALMAAKARNGSISAALDGFSRYGIDPTKLATTSMRSLMSIEYGTHADRLKQAKYLQGLTGTQALKKEERAQLDSAVATPGADDGKLKGALVKLSATRDMEKNAGDQSRESLANIDNATSDLATKLIPLTASIRDAIAAVAKKFGYEDKFANSEGAKTELDKALGAIPNTDEAARINRLNAERDEVRKNPEKYTQDYRDHVEKAYTDEKAKAPRAVAAGANTASPDVTKPIVANKAEFLAKTRKGAEAAAAAINAEGYSTKAEWLQAQLGLETGWGAHVLPGTNNPGNIKVDRNWKGRRATFKVKEYDRATGQMKYVPQEFKVFDSLEEGIKDYGRLLKDRGQYLPVREARTAEQFASAMGRSGYATDPEYGAKLRRTIAGMPAQGDVQLPPGARAAASPSTPQSVQFHGTFSLKDQRTGRDLTDPLTFSHMAAPQPAGARR
ncbi:glycoside hydrolase family 73 protein [Cupriavidus pinatubonensis]|uniref:Mannosyl-glycoprotein endo-beta-N-acetylglucosamidase-like domain-containing protein n=1 Tax=Cupriavidus pinatubonensis TaxID=248026 RepID=A0ABM8WL98_9BURK|nr:glucosaminidase domain-containing protein [Cupriavidus pinatubonensis]CAG9168146.1 hypothetical protein LMG23994_01320 [Cupriavidus pinatubonensis]